MNRKVIFSFIITAGLVLLMIQPVKAQRLLKKLGEKAQDRIEQRMEQKAEQKLDEKIDESLDSLENAAFGARENAASHTTEARNAAQEERMRRMMKGFGLSGEPVPIADNYSFNHLIQMHVESFDKDGKKISEGEFITHLAPDSKSMAYQMISGDMAEPGQGMFIIDAENGATIILSEENGEKTGVVYGLGTFFQGMGEIYDESVDEQTPDTWLANPNVKKTGRTKTIAGMKCDEYHITDEESESDIWITQDMRMNTRDFFSTLFKTSLYSHGIPWGYMMETTTNDKVTGEKSTMQVTKVDKNSNQKFAMSDYQITNLGSFNIPEQEEEKE